MTELILLGAGGHARSVLAALRLQDRTVLGYLAPQPGDLGGTCAHLGDDDAMGSFDPGTVRFVNGVGSVASTASRRALHQSAVARGFRAAQVVHPRAFVDAGAQVGEGVQVLAGAIVNVGAILEEGALINTGAIIEHDVIVGSHAHVSPGAVLAGGVRIGDGAHVGLGARVIQGVTVGPGSLIGAGAVVIQDVPAQSVVVGVPARAIASEKRGPA